MPRNSCIYKLAKPETFRRSSTKIFEKWGGNTQNVKKEMRQIYVPDGYDYNNKSLVERCQHYLTTGDIDCFTDNELDILRIFVQRDQAGAEALVVAYLCSAGDYRSLFVNGIKPHVYVAMKLFPAVWQQKLDVIDFDIGEINRLKIPDLKKSPYWKPLDALIKDSDHWSLEERYYYFAKQTCHSANYGVGEYAFRMNTLEKSGGKVVFSTEQAEYFLSTYRSLFPEIVEWNQRVSWEVRNNAIIYNILGFPCQITGYNLPESILKDYIAWGPQSAVGEITRIAFSRMQEYIEQADEKWDLMADTHDSYMVQCPLRDVKRCEGKMQEFMNQRMVSPMDGVEFYMRSESKAGFNWNDFGPTNPVGLRELQWN